MSSEATRTPVAFSKGHIHGLDYIASFPELGSAPAFDDKQEYVRDSIKYQLMAMKPGFPTRYINVRECFKMNSQKDVEFCLQNKAPDVTFQEAARFMGYLK